MIVYKTQDTDFSHPKPVRVDCCCGKAIAGLDNGELHIRESTDGFDGAWRRTLTIALRARKRIVAPARYCPYCGAKNEIIDVTNGFPPGTPPSVLQPLVQQPPSAPRPRRRRRR